jgi:hypothetical protein
MDAMNGNGNGGPSWKWITGVLLGIILSLIGGMLIWIATTVQALSANVPRLTAQMEATNAEMLTMQAQLIALNIRVNAIDNTSSISADWIASHVLADRAIKLAREARKKP